MTINKDFRQTMEKKGFAQIKDTYFDCSRYGCRFYETPIVDVVITDYNLLQHEPMDEGQLMCYNPSRRHFVTVSLEFIKQDLWRYVEDQFNNI